MKSGIKNLKVVKGAATTAAGDVDQIKKMFPNVFGAEVITFEPGQDAGAQKTINAGVILSGGQAPGGHNVIAGIFDALKEANPENKLYGFLGGPSGIIDGKYMELTADYVQEYGTQADLISSAPAEQSLKRLNSLKKLSQPAKNWAYPPL